MDASQLFLEVASTPPNLGGEFGAPFQFIHTLIDRAYPNFEIDSGKRTAAFPAAQGRRPF